METVTISLIISIISITFVIINFAVSRKDKAVKDSKEMNMGLINFRLDKLDEKVEKILEKFDTFYNEVDMRIEKAIEQHIEIYHKK